MPRYLLASLLVAVGAACSTATPDPGTGPSPGAVSVASGNPLVVNVVGTAFQYDASRAGAAFSDPQHQGLLYAIGLSAPAPGVVASGATLSGVPQLPGITHVTVVATDIRGATATDTFTIVTFAAGLTSPALPATALRYADAEAGLPLFYTGANVAANDNTPATNPVTDAGATLGRVLFHDPRLSATDRVACASCHLQSHGFSDTAQFSHGFAGGLTARHAMGLTNVRYYRRGKFFWDERAASLTAQALQPIQNAVEMGLTLDQLVTKLGATSYYPALFQAAFGSPAVTSDRVGLALAQYLQSIVSYQSRYDQEFSTQPPSLAVLTPQEQLGQQLFMPVAGSPVQTLGCDRCHTTAAMVSDDIHNNGLDLITVDTGAGNGRFKAPSLRNIGARGPYMHDGRFATLAQVVEHYNSGVQPNPALDVRLKNPDGTPHRLNLTQAEKDALVAFLNALTDPAIATDPRFGSPFAAH